jgi:hypothetical protein
LTLWLSTMPALGWAARPACSRAAMVSTIQICCHTPSCPKRRK